MMELIFDMARFKTIWNLFGIDGPTLPDLRLISRIDELVGNRNSIAHGRLTANEVGRDYSAKDLGRIIKDVSTIANHVIASLEDHIQNQKYLRVQMSQLP